MTPSANSQSPHLGASYTSSSGWLSSIIGSFWVAWTSYILFTYSSLRVIIPLVWTPEAEDAFKEVKNTLLNATLLVHWTCPPASSLMHQISSSLLFCSNASTLFGPCLPTSPGSCHLAKPGTVRSTVNYCWSTWGSSASGHCEAILYCHRLQTTHKCECFALDSQSKHHSPCQICHLDFISQFTSDILSLKGSSNTAADALSRVDVDALCAPLSSTPSVNFAAMARAQKMTRHSHSHLGCC